MERTILFKAKRLDGKGWAIGNLLHSYENGAIIVPIEGGGAFSVDPSTVCQFTGIKDMNGKEIWEHDIIYNPFLDDKAQEVTFNNGVFMIDGIPLSEEILFEENVIHLQNLGSKFDRKEGEK